MIEECAIVTETGDGYAWVEVRRRSACGGCQASTGCGAATLAQLWSGRPIRMRVESEQPLRPGDEVVVGLAEGALLRGALLAYLLPLMLLLAGALLGNAAFAGAGEEPVILAGLMGLGLGFWVVRVISRWLRNDARLQPVIVRYSGTARNMLSAPR